MPGEGSIFRLKNGRWRAQISIGPRSSRRFRTRTVSTRTAARVALDELRDDQRHGLARPSRLMTGDYLEQWVRDARNIRATTRDSYRSDVVNHLVPSIGHIRLVDLTPLDVEHMLSTLAPTMSPKNLRNIHGTLRRALNQAVRAEILGRNVASREYVDTPRVPDREPDAFSRDEVRAILDITAGDRHEALFVMAVGTGLRSGELLGLAWEDVDLPGRRVHVRQELVRREGRYVRDEPKTERSRRTVPLAPSVVATIERHRDRLKLDGFVPTSTGPVFVNRRGGPLSSSWLSHHAKAVYERAGVRPFDFKALRATFASRLYEAGVPDLEVAKLLGHTRTHTTKRHYISVGDHHGSAVDAVEALVGQSRSQSPHSRTASAEGV